MDYKRHMGYWVYCFVKINKAILRKYHSMQRALYTYAVRIKAREISGPILIGGEVRVTNNTSIGEYVSINGLVIKGRGPVYIGSYTHFGYDCLMITDIHNYDEGSLIPYDNTVISKEIRVGACVWVGDRVIILGGVEIGEGAVIQAGSVVSRSIAPYAVVGGNPAKMFKMRNVSRYQALKANGKFNQW